jgi:hypothetical protein
MDQVIKKLEEGVEVLRLRIRSYEGARAEAMKSQEKSDAAEQTNAALNAQLSDKLKAVGERETRVGQIESLQALEQTVKGNNAALAATQERFANEQEKALKKLADDQAAVVAARAKLADREKKLDDDRRSYKATVMKQLLDAGWKGPSTED